MELFTNTPLMIALFAIIFAQFIKIPIQYAVTRELDWKLFTSTGGMPSSHSAAVTSLTTAVAYEHGVGSTIFAVSTMFAVITMYDATGVRFQAGQQALTINKMRTDLQLFMNETRNWPKKKEEEKIEELKTLLGHKPSEVFMGALTGIAISAIVYSLIL
ncbi:MULTISPECIES: divergent PAP2 family protein [Planococcaceae]|uniref:Divergent PAP2 family protein n=1 Tax=Planococcus halotolerans TaxID=2233542 RepID=A0A365KN98_9BACL|nr:MULTISPECIES: divergent PAP2 family protein [Planococcaceae]QHJ71804.1 divergent PAP2 family protein [Planococcus halotolerans]RAZ74565.1 divergent PAP2 family protein [Planococcus halotolerans]RLQ85157.1 divergent PAP2 family protein [Planomicrobium sp. Y74]